MIAVSLLSAYLLGSIPFAYVLVRILRGQDIRSIGSGNVGATNALRAAGKAIGIMTLLLDAGKGYAAVILARLLTQGETWAIVAAVVVVLGHVHPAGRLAPRRAWWVCCSRAGPTQSSPRGRQ